MIDQAARALTGLHIVSADGSVVAHRDVARAVIEAMREPSLAMMDAGYCKDLDGAPPDGETVAELEAWWAQLSPEDIWPAMIDAALAGENCG